MEDAKQPEQELKMKDAELPEQEQQKQDDHQERPPIKPVKRYRSKVWDHFTMQTEDRCVCRYCDKVIQRQRSSTTSMMNHLKCLHKIFIMDQNSNGGEEQHSLLHTDKEQRKIPGPMMMGNAGDRTTTGIGGGPSGSQSSTSGNHHHYHQEQIKRAKFEEMSSSKDREHVSKLMGEYLLQGFTMLDEHCFTCNTPLMKRRNEQQSICLLCRNMARNRNVPENSNVLHNATPPMVSPEGTSLHESVSTMPLIRNTESDPHADCKQRVKGKIGSALENLTSELVTQSSQLQFDSVYQRTQTIEYIGSLLKLIEPAVNSFNSL